jgi:Fe-S cluster assembly protein SufD
MSLPLSAWTASAWQSAQAQIPAPEWLAEWRIQQLREFLKRGFPQKRDESWKYTSITALLDQTFSLAEKSTSTAELDLPTGIADSYRLVFVDGKFSPEFSNYQDLPQKILLTHNTESLAISPKFYQNFSTENLSIFHFLNGALMSDGLHLFVPDNYLLNRPVHLLSITTSPTKAVMHHPRHHIHLGVNSRVEFVEEYYGLGQSTYFNNVMTQISIGDNAELHYYKIQRENPSAFHIANTSVIQGRDSRFRAFHLAVGAKLNREDVHVELKNDGADCELSGFYYPQARQHMDFHTRIDHSHARTHSRQYYKGMIAAQGHAVFNGKIIVHPQAQQITAKQENHNLLLANSAEVDTKPELEVFADNVQCTHGATVGHLDLNALFYLRSRGIPEDLARNLLMRGFIQEILDLLPSPAVATYLQKIVGE